MRNPAVDISRAGEASASAREEVPPSPGKSCPKTPASPSKASSARYQEASSATRWPPSVNCAGPGEFEFPSTRGPTASSTCSATVRPKRASHALGMWSVFSIVPVASPSARYAPEGFDSTSFSVSELLIMRIVQHGD